MDNRDEMLDAETPEEKFSRLATKRVNATLNQLRLCRQLAVGPAYRYTPEQAETIMVAIRTEVDNLERDLESTLEKRSGIPIKTIQL